MATFTEKPNTAVFTSIQVMVANAPITYVVHDEDGDWQFFGPGRVEDKDVLIVSLLQVVQHDPSILEIADLAPGAVAVRDNPNAPWRRGST